ncbi:MAG: hypothetical protein PV344_08630, partial [Anaplasma sp.]|nr:hypothetical protein [Anaplasma sp.]
MLPQHDSARRHTARTTAEKIGGLLFERIPHPPDRPDLAPSDFYLFGPTKRAPGGMKFDTDDDLKVVVVHSWLRSQSQEYFFSRHLCVGEALAHMCRTW